MPKIRPLMMVMTIFDDDADVDDEKMWELDDEKRWELDDEG